MSAKYQIDYAVPFNGHVLTEHHQLTNDPVACEQFLADLLDRGVRIRGISHDGRALPAVESDKLIKTAAGIMATRRLCTALDLDSVEVHRRFGSPA
jgi:hypothetical protein